MDTLRPPSATELQSIVDRRELCVTVYSDTGPRVGLDDAIHQVSIALRRDHDDATHTAVLDQLRTVSAAVRTPIPAATAIFTTTTDARSVALQSATPPTDAGFRVHIADRFVVAPMFADLDARIRVMALALSQNSVRLVEADPGSPRPIAVPDLPTSLHSFDALDLTNDRQTLAHLRTSEEPTIRERQYVRAIDEAIGEVLDPATLLVVAAAEPLAGLFAELSRHPRLARPGITGNADDLTADELAMASLPALERERAAVRRRQFTRLAEFPDRHLVSADPAVILAAAGQGAIDTLFVDLDAVDGTGRVDDLARAAHRSGARIVGGAASELLGRGAAAAILRYPVDAEET